MMIYSEGEIADERRRKPRIYKNFPIQVWGTGDDRETFEVSTVLDNLSSIGLYFRVAKNIREGAKLNVIIQMSTVALEGLPISKVFIEGVVIRRELYADGMYGVAVFFEKHKFVH